MISPWSERKQRVALEHALEEVISATAVDDQFRSALSYALFPGGKRLRPMLALGLAHDLGICPTLVLEFAVSVELLHCASLVHDDLPALDNDVERRGKPSLHVAFGESSAVLVGDYLTGLAFRVLSSSKKLPSITAVQQELARAFCAVSYGQFLDLSPNSRAANLQSVHENKTGALFGSIFAGVSTVAELSDELTQRARAFGAQLGIFFQQRDDFLDNFASENQRGRKRRSDADNERVTDFTGCDLEQGKVIIQAHAAQLEEQWHALCDSIGAGELPLTTARIQELLSTAVSH